MFNKPAAAAVVNSDELMDDGTAVESKVVGSQRVDVSSAHDRVDLTTENSFCHRCWLCDRCMLSFHL